jgi:hypothetical protein
VRVDFRENLFTESLPSNENLIWTPLSRLLDVTPQYLKVNKIGILGGGGGVQLGLLSTTAPSRPIVLSPGDYDDGEIGGIMIDRGNRSIRRKPAPVPLCPHKTALAVPGREPGSHRWETSD